MTTISITAVSLPGHTADCTCTGCCTADMAAHLTANGVSPARYGLHKPAPAPAPRSTGSGTGYGRKRRTTTGGDATPAQIELLRSLITQICGTDKALMAQQLRLVEEHLVKGMTKEQATELIEFHIPMARRANATRNSAAHAAHTAELELGALYQVGQDIYRIHRNGRGFKFAKQLIDGEFEYVKGAISLITPAHRMTKEQAQAYGRATGQCCVCNRTLTNPESIEEGIGPVCGGRW